MLTIEKLNKARDILNELTPPSTPVLIFNIEIWRADKDFNWTDEELEKAKFNGGFIGKKFSINCYLSCFVLGDSNAEVEVNITD